ncbi:MAG: signal peptidase I [Treponema sp.]|nr:signal peptidase I [Treponema sp.]
MKQKLSDYSFEVKKRNEQRIVSIIMLCLVIFFGITLVRSFLLFSVRQRSASMQPDMPKSAHVFFTPITGTISRGDVVLLRAREREKQTFFRAAADMIVRFFTAQQRSLARTESKMGASPQIRRIVALPGDTIYMRGYVLFVRPKGEQHFLTEFERTETPYNVNIVPAPSDWDNAIGVNGSFEQRTLKEDEYFVLADNRASAIDSRLWGAVLLHDIQAKGLAVYFPFSKMRLL